jgi:hypothetical protein
MLEIDIKHSDLAKQNMTPMLFRLRSSSTSKIHPKPSLNVHNRIEDLKKISD